MSGIVRMDNRYLWLVNGCLEYYRLTRPIIINACQPKWSKKSRRQNSVLILQELLEWGVEVVCTFIENSLCTVLTIFFPEFIFWYIYFWTHIGRLCPLFVTSWNSVVKWEMYVLLLDANFIFLQTQRKVKSAPRTKLKRGKLKMYKDKCWYVADREHGGKDIMYISCLRASFPGRCVAAGWE